MRRGLLAAALIFGAACSGSGAAGTGPEVSGTPITPPSVSIGATPAPTPAPSLSFAVLGDFGSATSAEYDVAERMCSWREDFPFDLVITTGDNVYPDGHPSRFDDAFYQPLACLLEEGVTFHASLGNHDIKTRNGRPEMNADAFGMGGRRNYVVRTGGVRFVIADSNYLNMEFLRRATRARAGDRWTVVAMHHPTYSPGTGHGSEPGFADKLPRLFRRRGVDLVLQGHDHIYAVTKPLSGIRYVVTGGGGAGLYGCSDQWFSAKCEARHHFLYVTADDESIVVRAIPTEGRPFHRFSTTGLD